MQIRKADGVLASKQQILSHWIVFSHDKKNPKRVKKMREPAVARRQGGFFSLRRQAAAASLREKNPPVTENENEKKRRKNVRGTFFSQLLATSLVPWWGHFSAQVSQASLGPVRARLGLPTIFTGGSTISTGVSDFFTDVSERT